MGLITDTIEVKLGSANMKHYENLGYKIPRKNNVLIKKSTIVVLVNDLQKGSHTQIEYTCDNCGVSTFSAWKDFLKVKKNDTKTFCRKCLYSLCSVENSRISKLEKGLSFYKWCVNNNRRDILIRWDYEKTGFSPKDVSFHSAKRVYLFCQSDKNHVSEIHKIRNLPSGKSKDLNCKQCNSLGYCYPESFVFWSNINENNPSYFSRSSSSVVYWKCENGKHEDYKRKISASVVYEYRCPRCIKESKESVLQEKVRKYLQKISNKNNFEINHEHDCYLVCKNKKTKHILPYDNEVFSEYLKLIIETHSKQHYELGGFHKLTAKHNHTLPEFEFEQYKKRDEYKKQYALSQGYYYLEIPYWADDENETYKIMIDDMLDYIYENINE